MFGLFSHEVQTIYRTNMNFAALTEQQHVITSVNYGNGGAKLAKKEVIYV